MNKFSDRITREGITFDDVLLVPAWSEVHVVEGDAFTGNAVGELIHVSTD